MTCAILGALTIAALCTLALVAETRRADRHERERLARRRAKEDRA